MHEPYISCTSSSSRVVEVVVVVVVVVAVWNSWHQEICTEWPQTELKDSDMKSILHMEFPEPGVPNFHPFRSTINRFQDNAHFRIYPLTPNL